MWLTVVILSTLGCLLFGRSEAAEHKIVCYYSSWATYRNGNGRFTPENIDPKACTHIVYAFAGLATDYTIFALDPWLSLEEGGGLGDYWKFTSLKHQNPSTKLLIGVGGWNEDSARYSRMISTPQNRNTFIQSALSFFRRHRFDGLNLDWQYPANRGGLLSDKKNFVLLLKELREACDKNGYMYGISAAGNMEITNSGYDVPEVTKYPDYVSLLSYDYHGGWETKTGMNAPLYPKASESPLERNLNQDATVSHWLKKGADAKKLLLGIPTYGRTFMLRDQTRSDVGSSAQRPGNPGPYTQLDGYLGYNEIIEKFIYQDGWKIEWDNEQRVPFAHNEGFWIGYDNEESVKIKAEYALQKGLGGAMIWSLETDDFHGLAGRGSSPLLATVKKVLSGESVDFGNQTIPTIRPTPPTSAPNPKEPKCTKPGNFQLPTDCTQFYSCIARSGGFQMTFTKCPHGLAFNDNTKTCDWKEAVEGCQ